MTTETEAQLEAWDGMCKYTQWRKLYPRISARKPPRDISCRLSHKTLRKLQRNTAGARGSGQSVARSVLGELQREMSSRYLRGGRPCFIWGPVSSWTQLRKQFLGFGSRPLEDDLKPGSRTLCFCLLSFWPPIEAFHKSQQVQQSENAHEEYPSHPKPVPPCPSQSSQLPSGPALQPGLHALALWGQNRSLFRMTPKAGLCGPVG